MRQHDILLPLLAMLACAMLPACSSRPDLRDSLPHVAPVRSTEFVQATGALLSGAYVPGNKIVTLHNGDEIFPAMLAAIRGARRSVNFESYVFEKGDVPAQFANALSERARAGVRVKVILDDHGASKAKAYYPQMRESGVVLETYHPVFGPDLSRSNHRTHRKLLVVDGRIGFLGGVGIADQWKGKGNAPDEWRDLHYKVEGPVVAQLQAAFNNNWLKTHHEVLQGLDYFPPLHAAGSLPVGTLYNISRTGSTPMELMCHLTVASVQRSLLIETPYFLPDKRLVDGLCAASRRGVAVHIIMPGKFIDIKAVRRASKKCWKPLLQAGVHLYEFQPTMIHSKLMVADGVFVSVGSMNLDPRSQKINDEANIAVISESFAREQTRVFESDLKRCKPVRLDDGGKLVDAPMQALQAPFESQL
jgi:cardiolipin synthase